MTPGLAHDILEGGYWLVEPGPNADVSLAVCGPVIQEAIEAHRQILEDIPDAGLLVVTSPDRLQRGWIHAQRSAAPAPCHIERLLGSTPRTAGMVTILDGHAATLSWLGAVRGQAVIPLGVERFGQSGSIADLYRTYGLDADAILDATARLCVGRRVWTEERS
jgi:pyruvate dehydrogenase E1 component